MKKRLSNSEIKEINDKLSKSFNLDCFISKNDKVEVDENIIFINEEKLLFIHETIVLPTLRLLMKKDVSQTDLSQKDIFILRKITVDMGAIPFIIKGADIMRPGIKEIDQGIKKDDFILIIDMQHKKNIALGKALFSAEDMQSLEKGRVIKNVHYVGDSIWKV